MRFGACDRAVSYASRCGAQVSCLADRNRSACAWHSEGYRCAAAVRSRQRPANVSTIINHFVAPQQQQQHQQQRIWPSVYKYAIWCECANQSHFLQFSPSRHRLHPRVILLHITATLLSLTYRNRRWFVLTRYTHSLHSTHTWVATRGRARVRVYVSQRANNEVIANKCTS